MLASRCIALPCQGDAPARNATGQWTRSPIRSTTLRRPQESQSHAAAARARTRPIRTGGVVPAGRAEPRWGDPTAVLRDIAATDSGGISWATYTTAGRAHVEQPAAARFSANSGDRYVDIATDAWKLRIEPDRITSIVCVYLPGMGSAAEIQASRFNLRVEFRGADRHAVVAAWYANDRGRQFDEVCDKHHLPGELDGVR